MTLEKYVLLQYITYKVKFFIILGAFRKIDYSVRLHEILDMKKLIFFYLRIVK